MSLAPPEKNIILIHQVFSRFFSHVQSPIFALLADVDPPTVLEMFGKMFFEFCQESGYDEILKVLGGTTHDFLENLDALHDHLATIYPGMRAPSFRCSKLDDGTLVLHYYSEREGLENIVIGIVKTVAKSLHNADIEVKVIKAKSETCDHVQFGIYEKNKTDKIAKEIEISNILSMENKISPSTFSRTFPFHILFDRNMRIIQVGSSLLRVIPETGNDNCVITDVFEMVRPHMDFSFDHILSHINTVYVLRALCLDIDGLYIDKEKIEQNDSNRMRLKGQMIHVKESDCMMFLCSPSVANLDDLQRRGLYLSDIPLHDATRDLVLLSEKFAAGYKLTQRLEILNDELQSTHRQLEFEKKGTDRYVIYI